MEEVKSILASYSSLKTSRTGLEGNWEKVQKVFLPLSTTVEEEDQSAYNIKRNGQFSTKPAKALRVLTAGFHSYLTNPSSDWFGLRIKDQKLNKMEPVKLWLQEVDTILRESINGTNFNTQQDGFYNSSGCYGTSVMFIEDDVEDDFRFYNIPIKNIYLEEDSKERISAFYIKYMYTCGQAVDRFGIDNVSASIKKKYEKNSSDTDRSEFLLVVGKRHKRDESKEDALNMPIYEKWVDVDNNQLMSEGGYLSMPFAYHRWEKIDGIAYGNSPCLMSLKNATLLNSTLELGLEGMAKTVSPPVTVPSKGYISKLNFNPRSIMTRAPNTGTGEIEQVGLTTNLSGADYYTEFYIESIKEDLHNDAINALSGISKRMNDTEVQELVGEKMAQLGPAVGRFIDEFLNNVISRCLAILQSKGKLPQPPEELGADFQYKIEYVSPLAKAQRINEFTSIQSVYNFAGQLMQADPSVVDNFDFDATVRLVGDITGSDLAIFKSEDQVAEIRDNRAKKQKIQQDLENQTYDLETAKQAVEVENEANNGK